MERSTFSRHVSLENNYPYLHLNAISVIFLQYSKQNICFGTKSIFHINWAIVYKLLTGLHYGTYKAWVVRHLTPLTQRLRLLTGCSIVGLAASAPSGGSTKLYLEYWTQTLFALYRCNKALALCIAEEQQAQCV